MVSIAKIGEYSGFFTVKIKPIGKKRYNRDNLEINNMRKYAI